MDKGVTVKMGAVVAFWIILKVTAFAGRVRKKGVEDCEPLEGWSCRLLRRGRRWMEEQVAGAGVELGGSFWTGALEILRHPDRDVDSLVGCRS